MKEKVFLIKEDDIKKNISDQRNGIASDTITVDGLKICYMYRDDPDEDIENDSGWRFMSGTETQDYADDIDNSQIFSLNTISNYEPAIIEYLKLPIGTELERDEKTGKFIKVQD